MAKKRKAGRLGAAAVPLDPLEEATQPNAQPSEPPPAASAPPAPVAQAPVAADSQLAVAVEPPEVTVTKKDPLPPQKPVSTLASRVADAAAAQLLIFDELPEDEKPRPNDRVLLVGIVWGHSTLVELEQVTTGGDLPVSRLFDLPSVKLPKNFPLVKHDGQDHVLSLPDDIHA